MIRNLTGAAGACSLALAFVPAAGAAVSAPAAAAATHCTAEGIAYLTPGLALKDAPSSFHVDPGPATCDGPVQGLRTTGPGTYSTAGRSNGAVSCVGGGSGWAVGVLSVPTKKGIRTITNPLTFTFGAVTSDGLLTGRYEGDYMSGTFTVTPVKGDCVTSAVTKAKATFDFTVHGFRAPR